MKRPKTQTYTPISDIATEAGNFDENANDTDLPYIRLATEDAALEVSLSAQRGLAP